MLTMESIKLISSFNIAREITRKNAKTFYFASRFLPLEKQRAAYSVYAVCRISDDSVDSIQNPNPLSKLNKIDEKIALAYKNEVDTAGPLYAFQDTIKKYAIPKQYFDDLIKGMHMDLRKKRYLNFDELYQYCYRVAGVIGLIMLKIFGVESDKADGYAVDLGIAMQLTNILRDIKEDFENGRIYLPYNEMDRFGINEQYISESKIDDNFTSFMNWQISRARQYYQRSSEGIKLLKEQRSRLVVHMMKDIYAAILKAIEKNKYNVFSKRVRVSTFNKSLMALKILIKGEY